MKCLRCKKDNDRVVDSREGREGAVIRRRRECNACQRRFTSYERVEEIPAMVLKRDGRREEFDRSKLLRGLRRACEKRPVEMRILETICDDVESAFAAREEKELSTADIGGLVMEKLKELDQVAYVRFASVYRSFRDVNELMNELKSLVDNKGRR